MTATVYRGALSDVYFHSTSTAAGGSPSAGLRDQYVRLAHRLFAAHTWSSEFRRTEARTAEIDAGWLLSVLRRVDVAYEDGSTNATREGAEYYEDTVDDWDWQ